MFISSNPAKVFVDQLRRYLSLGIDDVRLHDNMYALQAMFYALTILTYTYKA